MIQPWGARRPPLLRPLVALLVVGLLAGACGSATVPSASSSGASASAPPPSGSVDDLAGNGITIVADESGADTAQRPRLLLTRVQADRLLADLDGGVLGADLDALAPPADGMVPMSYLLAAWLTSADTPASKTAARWMRLPERQVDWTRAPNERFPLAVVALFVADLARLVDEAMPPAESDSPAPPSGATGRTDTEHLALAGLTAALEPFGRVGLTGPVVAADGPCSTVTNFLAKTIDGLFSALRLTVPASGGGFFSDLAGVLARVWNTAVSYAQRVVQGLVDTVTAPVFEAIRLGVGALGVATVLVSYLQDQRLIVSVQPAQVDADTYHFAVGSEPDVRGQFVARTASLTGSWPPFLVDCAKVAGATLPELIAPGAEATWSVVNYAVPVIAPGPLATKVGSDLTARLDFVTGRESEEQARGEATWDGVVASVAIPRKEVNDFLDLGREQIQAAEQLILSRIPEPNLRQLAQQSLTKVVDPLVDQLQGEVTKRVPGVFTLRGSSAILLVKYHKPPEPTPTASPTAPPSADPKTEFCNRYRAMLTWWWYDADLPAGSQSWAAEIVRRLLDMRPYAPANLLGAVDIHIGLYRATATYSGPELAREAAPWAAQMPVAVAALDAYCGIKPGEFGR